MTTEASKVVHSPGGVNGASCGAPFTADIRFTAKPSKVTCPACLTAMGEPRVVSGTDAVAATVKPDHVAVGQRWRDRLGVYSVLHAVNGAGNLPRAWLICHGVYGLGWRTDEDIMADEYLGVFAEETAPARRPFRIERSKEWWMARAELEGDSPVAAGLGTVPAPAETPPKVSPSGKPVWFPEPPAETPAPPQAACVDPACIFKGPHAVHAAAAAPAPPGPVEPPTPDKCPACAKVARHPGEGYVCAWHGPGTCEVRECYGELVVVVDGHALCESHRLGRGADDPVPPAFLGAAPPGPVEVTHSAQDTAPLVTRCGLTWSWAKRFAWTDGEDATPVTCPACLAAAAPAPGVGEGARELTFAEAMALPIEQVEVQLQGEAVWRPLHSGMHRRFDVMAVARYRRRPEPLPAPAPKPGRLDELVNEWCDRDAPMPMDLAHDVAREALACVRRQRGFVPADFESCLERAAVELLGAEAGK